MKKRLAVILLCFCMLFSLLPTAALATDTNETSTTAVNEHTSNAVNLNPFEDVSELDWFYQSVLYASDNGLFSGTSQSSFEPYLTMTRSMYVTVMGRIAGINVKDYTGSTGYTDVAPSAWYAPSVVWAEKMGIAGGTGNGLFSPDSPVTREQMAVMLLRYFEVYKITYGKSAVLNKPVDINQVSSWARDAVLKLWGAGVFEGDSSGHFNPQAKATRAECAVITMRVDKAVKGLPGETVIKPEDGGSGPVKSTAATPGSLGSTVTSDTYYTVTFNTNGGSIAASQQVLKGQSLASVPVTQKEGATFLGWYTDRNCTAPFYAEDPVTSDLTLYAKYAGLDKQEQFMDDTFTLADQQPGLTFKLTSQDVNLTAADVKSALTLENIDRSDYVNLMVKGKNGAYTVSAEGGFSAGGSYKLTLGEGLAFESKKDAYRICTFTIQKDEVIHLSLSDDLIYISSSDISGIKRNNESVDSLSVALVGNNESITGSFIYAQASQLSKDNLLCIYTGVKPADRDTVTDYSNSAVAYVKVTSATGTTVNYSSIDETEAKDVLYLPDTLPINKAKLAQNEDLSDGEFNIATSDLDFSTYLNLGLDTGTTVDAGDFLVFYAGSLDSNEDITYGKVTDVTVSGSSTSITFTGTTAEAIHSTNLDYYTKDDISGETMLKDVDVDALEQQIETQATESGFAEAAMKYLAGVATETDGFRKIASVENFVLTDEKGQVIDSSQLKLMGGVGFDYDNENIKVTAEIGTNTRKFGKGVRVALGLQGEFTVDAGKDNEIKINLSATFEEEVKMSFNADGGAIWDWWGIFPYIRDYRMNAKVDVYNFTGISLQAKVSSAVKDDAGTIIDFTGSDISRELKKLLDVEDPDTLDAGLQDLFEQYGEMLKTETDYIHIVDYTIVEVSSWVDPLCIIAYSFKVNFVVSANVNVWLGANFEYTSGTRYNFWFEIRAKKAGNSSMDLMDEVYRFQFYVMGTLGLRAGLELEFAVGLFSTDLASIGIGAEFGAYTELYGYFIYELESVREAGQAESQVTTDRAGALYLEFGIYMDINFNAQALKNKYLYTANLYKNQWPLLYAGNKKNVYNFGYEQPKADEATVLKDVTTYTLPESYRSMAVLDLKEGDLFTAVYPLDKYYYRLSNKNFSLDAATGQVNVNVPRGVQYMECDLTLTWKPDKLAFSKKDLSRTVHLVWTNLTTTELKEKYTVSVQAGNDTDGYTTVWSTRVNKGELPELPTKEDILTLLGYGKNTAIINNKSIDLKYTGNTGYSKAAVIANSDQAYTFEVTPRTYTLTVDGVQKADGTAASRSFTAKFGGSFDLSALALTGTRIAGSTMNNTIYTRYLSTESSNEDGKAADSIINTAFATQLLGNAASYNARYVDNSSTVTYQFTGPDGVVIDPVTFKVENGSVPVFDYSGYLLNQGVGYIAERWDKPIGKITGDTVFTATCGVPEGEAFAITFETNGGSTVSPMPRYPGVTINAPAEPLKEGYTFAGWYSDAALATEYTFRTMPKNSFTLYAKWTANQYTLSFQAVGGEGITPNKNVTYGESYGSLPAPVRAGYTFLGWYTEMEGGLLVNGETVVTTAGNHTLYARWGEKRNVEGIITAPQSFTYDTTPKAFTLSGTDLTGFTVQYKLNGTDSYTSSVVNAGSYSVQITRPEDEAYNAFTVTLNNGLVVNRAIRHITVDTPTFRSATFSTVTVNAVPVPNQDGTMMYAANTVDAVPGGGWTTSATVGGLSANQTYYVFAKVTGGENYEDVVSAGTSMTTATRTLTPTTTSWSIQTGTDSGAGTDANVGGKVLFADGSRTDRSLFNGHGNDFENGDHDAYDIQITRDPWMISGINIGNDGAQSNSPWQLDYVDFAAAGLVHSFKINDWFDNSYADYGTTDFRRAVTSAGAFDQWGGTAGVDSSSEGTIAFAYDGTISDQSYGTYNSFDKDDAPTITVTPSSSEYGHTFNYSNYDLTIDSKAIYQKMSERGDDQIIFTITLTFPARSATEGTATIVKTLVIKRT